MSIGFYARLSTSSELILFFSFSFFVFVAVIYPSHLKIPHMTSAPDLGQNLLE